MTSLTVHGPGAPPLRRSDPGSQDDQPHAPIPFDDLAHCHGSRVDDRNGRVGTVVGVLFGAWIDRPDAIEVRVGLFRRGLLVIPVDAVAEVLRTEKRVILHTDVDLADATPQDRVPAPAPESPCGW